MSPTRARPVPFCRHGFLPLPLTSARFFVMWVPRRSAALARTTDSQMRSPLTRPPNTSSRTSMAPTFSLLSLTTSSCMLLLSLLGLLDLRDLDPLRRRGFADDHVCGRRAGDAALEDQEMIIRIDAKHLQVADRHAPAAHAAGGAHPLDDARRKRLRA